MLEGAKYIKEVPFSSLFNWSVQYLSETKISFNSSYPMVSIGSFLTRNKTSVTIENGVTYKRVTIKVRNGGVVQRDSEIGDNIGTKRQYKVSEGQFILSKIDARNGAMGLIPSELEGAIVTQDFLPYDLDITKINPQYLVLVSTTKEFVAFCQTCSSGTTNRQRVDEAKFLDIKIPLPTIEEQNKLVADYNKKMALAARQESQALTKEQEIEEYIFDKLDITLAEQLEIKELQMVSFKDIDSWSVERLFKQEGNSELKSGIYSNVKLSTILKINPTTDIKALDNADAMSFIPMECVSDIYGEIKEVRDGVKLKSKGYTKFQNGDLIWARITPCMQNGKSALVNNLANGVGYGSTEYHVLRDVSGKVNMSYIHIILRLEAVLKNAMSHFTGSAGQQRVPKYFLESLSIPLPPIEIQNEIATHISGLKQEIKKLRTTAESNRKSALTNFEQKIF